MLLIWILLISLNGFTYAKVHLREFNITSIADKNGKSIISINGREDTIGPTLKVNAGDTINLLVNNELCEQESSDSLVQDYCSTSIHFHGLVLDNDKSLGVLCDGVPGVTQHSIPSGMSYWYNFTVPEHVCGTYWYHSHSSVQYGDGLRGLFLVECDPRSNYINGVVEKLASESTDMEKLEDLPSSEVRSDVAEELIIVSDWYHKSSIDILHEVMSPDGSPDPRVEGSTLNGDTGSVAFTIGENIKYMVFRFVNMGMSGTNVINIDGHRMCVIETDGVLTQPYLIDSLSIAVGQRFTVVVKLETADPIRIIHGCSKMMGYITKTHWILRTGQTPGSSFEGRIKNLRGYDVNERYLDFTPTKGSLLPQPEQQISLDYDFAYEIHDQYDTPMYLVNGDTMNEYFSDGLLILGDRGTRDPIHLETGQVVEVAINSIDHMRHPWHMHGHTFQVISVGQSRDGPLYFDDVDSPAMRKYKHDLANWEGKVPMTRDTINIPGHSYAVIRFVANNPGYWLLHCHVEWHMAKGLGVVFSEGNLDVNTLSLSEPFVRKPTEMMPSLPAGAAPINSASTTSTTSAKIPSSQAAAMNDITKPPTQSAKWKVILIYISIMCTVNCAVWYFGFK